VSLTKSHEGTGLGLYLSKKLLDFLGGDISAESEYGKGSEFTFTIPLRYKEDQRNEADTGG
jgi:signal transduction histidine kinase